MSAEQVGAGFSQAGKVISGLAPMLAAIPGVGPILALVGELAGEAVGIAGAGISLSAQQTAAIVAAVRNAIDVTKTVRAETLSAHAARTSETQRIIDEAKKGGAALVAEVKSTTAAIVEATSPERADPTLKTT